MRAQFCHRAVLALCVLASWALHLQHAQGSTFETVGPFTVEFWDPSDGSFTFGGRTFSANTVWTAIDRAAVMRAFEYWDERLAGNAAPRNVTIRLLTNTGEFDPGNNAYSANAPVNTPTPSILGDPNHYKPTTERVIGEHTNVAVPGGYVGVDNVIVLAPATGTSFSSGVSGPVPSQNWGIEPIVMHEFGHSLGYYTSFDGVGNLTNPLAVFDVYRRNANGDMLAPGMSFTLTSGGTFEGPTAMSVYGDGVARALPVHDWTHLNINPLLMTHVIYRNMPFFAEVELAVLEDLGYTINRSDFFGKSIYTDGAGAPENNATAFNSGAVYGVGLHLFAANRNITQTGNISVSGPAATGIRVDQPFTYVAGQPVVPESHNVVTVAPGTTIEATGPRSVGILASFGRGHTIVHRGSITTATADSQGILADFGTNLLDGGDDINSLRVGGYLLNAVDVSGTISAAGGAGNAIEIRNTAAVQQINFMNGSVVTGDIVCDALTGVGLNRPTVTFGHVADADGRMTAAVDPAFFLRLNGDIRSSTAASAMDAQLVGGTTEFNGTAYFHSCSIGTQAALAGNGTIRSDTAVQHAGTIAPGQSIGTITIVGSLNSLPSAVFDIEIIPGGPSPVAGTHYDLIAVSDTATINGGTVNITAAPAASDDYTPGSVYAFLQTGNGLTVTDAPTLVENITNRRVMLGWGTYNMAISFLRDESFENDIAQTPNQRAWGRCFDHQAVTLGNPNLQGIRNALDLMPDVNDVRHAMDQMTGEVHGTLTALGVQSTTNFFRLLATNTRDVIPTDGPWVLGYALGGNADSDGNAHGFTFSEGGTLIGFLPVGGLGWDFGLVYNYGRIDSSLRGIGSHGAVDVHRLGAHLSCESFGNHYEYVAAMVGYSRNDVTRQISYADSVPEDFRGSVEVAGTTNAAYDGVQTGVYAEHGMRLGTPSLNFRPYVGVQYVYLGQEGFTETGGGNFNLAIRHDDLNSLQVIPGIRLASDWPSRFLNNNFLLTFDAMYQHEFLDTAAIVGTSFASSTECSFAIAGLDLGRDSYRLGPGLEFQIGDVRLFADYQVIFNEDHVFHAGGGGLELNW